MTTVLELDKKNSNIIILDPKPEDVPIWNETCNVIVLPANKYGFSFGQSSNFEISQIFK